MKKFLITIAIALMAISAYAQKDIPAGASLELASIENNDKQFTLYKVKDLEGNPAFYLNVGRVTGSMSLSIGSTSSEFTSLDAAVMFIGETYEEAMETLDSLIEMFKEEDGAQREFECFGGETALCTLHKGCLGKHLSFTFPQGFRTGESEISRSDLKSLRVSMKISKKLHKDI